MPTVIFYSFLVFSSTFFVWLSEKGKGRRERCFFLLIAFLIVFIPSAIRYGIGVDFFSYINLYENIEKYPYVETGFYFVNWLLRWFDSPPQLSIASFAFLYTSIAIIAIPKKNSWLVFFVLMLTTYFISFNQIRQALAIVFTVWALRSYLNGQIIYSVLILSFGGLFHQSVWIVMPFIFLAKIPFSNNFKNYLQPLMMVSVTVFIIFNGAVLFNISEVFLHDVGLHKYAGYFSNASHFIENSGGSNLGVTVKMLFCFYFISISKHILLKSNDNIIILYFVFSYAVSTALASQIVIFSRLQSVFIPGLIYSIYILWDMSSYKKPNKIIALIFLFFLVSSFIKESFGVPSSYTDPMRNPYQTIFTKSGYL